MYWHNGRSLGHTARTGKIAHALVRDLPEVRITGISGAYRGLDLLPDEMDILKLPAFANYDRPSGWELSGRQGFDGPTLFRARAEIAEVFIRHYAPDVFIVDHLPYGAENELKQALSLPSTGKRILGLRGVLFDKEKTNRLYFTSEHARWIADHFDGIFVYTDPSVFSLEQSYDVPLELRDRIQYTGYLAESAPLTRAEARKRLGVDDGERLVVGSMGGGQGALPIWRAVLQALTDNASAFDRAYLVTGPYLEPEDLALLTGMTATLPWVQVVRYDPQVSVWMAASDLVIGAAGSNMLGEILAASCNAIVIPRQIREPEQEIHSGLLAARELVRTCGLESTLAGKLGAVVTDALRGPLCSSSRVQLGGATRYAACLNRVQKSN